MRFDLQALQTPAQTGQSVGQKSILGGDAPLTVQGDDDFLGKINSIISGINLLFDNAKVMQGNLSGQQAGQQAGQGFPNMNKQITQGTPQIEPILQAVDGRMLQVVQNTIDNKVFNIPISDLLKLHGDKSLKELMEQFAQESAGDKR